MDELRVTLNLFDSLISRATTGQSPPIHELASEARKRIAQMQRLVELLVACDDQLQQRGRRENAELIQLSNDAELFAEAFYLFGFRAREVLRQIPAFRRFECPGLRNVRNLLIEHPERMSQVMSGSFNFGGPEIAKLKPSRRPHETHPFMDPGLTANLREFSANLARNLQKLA